MFHSDIIKIAVGCGWQVSITACGDNSFYFDFQRITRNGLPFSFTAAMTGGRISSIGDVCVDGASVNTEISCCLPHGVQKLRLNLHSKITLPHSPVCFFCVPYAKLAAYNILNNR